MNVVFTMMVNNYSVVSQILESAEVSSLPNMLVFLKRPSGAERQQTREKSRALNEGLCVKYRRGLAKLLVKVNM